MVQVVLEKAVGGVVAPVALNDGDVTIMRKGMRKRRVKAVVAALVLLALIGVSGTSFADDNGSVSVDVATRDRIFEQIRGLPIPGMDSFSVGLDPVGHRIGVTIFAPKGLPAVAIGRLKFGDNVTVDVVEAEGPSPHADVRSGERLPYIGPNDVARLCTAGFAVGLKGGKSGFLTAGHCSDVLKPIEEQRAFAGPRQVPMIGHDRVFEPSDWGIYVFDGSPDENRSLPKILGGHGLLGIQGIAQPAKDMHVCKHGATTGTTCGTVTMLDVKFDYPAAKDSSGKVIRPAVDMEGMVQTDVCEEGGDSGGPVYTTSDDMTMAVGIISGGTKTSTGRCLETVGKANVSYVVPLSATSASGTDTSADVFLKVVS